jgi:hypothetical protein
MGKWVLILALNHWGAPLSVDARVLNPMHLYATVQACNDAAAKVRLAQSEKEKGDTALWCAQLAQPGIDSLERGE